MSQAGLSVPDSSRPDASTASGDQRGPSCATATGATRRARPPGGNGSRRPGGGGPVSHNAALPDTKNLATWAKTASAGMPAGARPPDDPPPTAPAPQRRGRRAPGGWGGP